MERLVTALNAPPILTPKQALKQTMSRMVHNLLAETHVVDDGLDVRIVPTWIDTLVNEINQNDRALEILEKSLRALTLGDEGFLRKAIQEMIFTMKRVPPEDPRFENLMALARRHDFRTLPERMKNDQDEMFLPRSTIESWNETLDRILEIGRPLLRRRASVHPESSAARGSPRPRLV